MTLDETNAVTSADRPGIDPILKALLDAVPLEFTIDDGVEVARAKIAAMRPPAAMLPDLRIETRARLRSRRPDSGPHLLAAHRW